LNPVDWSRPWLAPYRATGERVAGRIAGGASVAEALNAELAQPGPGATAPTAWASGSPRFVAQAALTPGQPYEAYIDTSACVPTRDNLHDLFNGLVWLRFPRLKRRLNALQADQIRQHGIGPERGATRDALTLFDESGVLLQASAPLVAALHQRDWQQLFVSGRRSWEAAQVTLFGHALMEQLCLPRKGLTGRVWCVPQRADVQDHFCAEAPEHWAHSRLASPMPVLGVPGWWADNERPGFYVDAQVFRAPRPAPGALPL
jgi:hypothetical protein